MGNHWKVETSDGGGSLGNYPNSQTGCGERQHVKDEQAKRKTIRKIYRLTSTISQYEHRPVPPPSLQVLCVQHEWKTKLISFFQAVPFTFSL
jgi:hypothetical protein